MMSRTSTRAFLLFTAILLCSCASRELPVDLLPHLVLHRGNNSIAPGNTIQGIELAYEKGFELIELDVRQTRDGAFFLFHDRRIHDFNSVAPREFRGRASESLTKQELSLLCSPKDPRHCPPLLHDVIQKMRGKKVTFLFDLKNISPNLLDKLVLILMEQKFVNQAIIQCPTASCAPLVRQHHRTLPVAIRVHVRKELSAALALKPFAVQLDLEELNDQTVRMIHGAGVKILVKTVDSDFESMESIKKLVVQGADLILTDLQP